VSERVLSLRELNRATLVRQLLLERRPLSVTRALERLAAVQAQWPTAPYIALWSRVTDFRREALLRALERQQVIRSTLMRTTIHMVSRRDFLALGALWRERRREEFERHGGDIAAAEREARAALADGSRSYTQLNAEHGEIFSRRFGPLVPLVHTLPAGGWRHHGRTPLAEAEPWLGATFDEPGAGARLLVERYLAGYGPASRADLLRFAGLRVKDVQPALDALESRLRWFRDEEGRTLLDLVRSPLPRTDFAVPVRFLGRWDNALLGYERRARILPDEYAARQIGLAGDQVVLVDGFVAAVWVVERATRVATVVLEALSPLPPAARRAVEEEAGRLVRWHEPEAESHRLRWS